MEHPENIPNCPLYQVPPTLKNSWKSVQPFSCNVANRQTDRQTDIATDNDGNRFGVIAVISGRHVACKYVLTNKMSHIASPFNHFTIYHFIYGKISQQLFPWKYIFFCHDKKISLLPKFTGATSLYMSDRFKTPREILRIEASDHWFFLLNPIILLIISNFEYHHLTNPITWLHEWQFIMSHSSLLNPVLAMKLGLFWGCLTTLC